MILLARKNSSLGSVTLHYSVIKCYYLVVFGKSLSRDIVHSIFCGGGSLHLMFHIFEPLAWEQAMVSLSSAYITEMEKGNRAFRSVKFLRTENIDRASAVIYVRK